jgi:Flp pilus assembly protein TadG
MSYVFVGLGMMAFLSASMLAIDVGMLMTARNQAQNSADAGALAGASALAFDSFTDRSATGPAVTYAIAAAKGNKVMAADVDVDPEDVVFLNDPEGNPSRIQVTVYRTAARGNPLGTLIAQYFKMPTAGVGATATAEVSPANGMTCVKPFTLPDKWKEVGTDAPWDGNDVYDAFDKKGKPLPASEADVYIPATLPDGKTPNPDYTGYNTEKNRGQVLVIRAQHGGEINVSFFQSLALGGVTGGSEYEWNIANCNKLVMYRGDPLIQEPGAMEGPTIHGIQDLIDKDPNAKWDEATGRVKDSAYPKQSPRVFPIPLYDPEVYDSGKRNGRTADLVTANWIGFFAEWTGGSEVRGRIIPIAGIRDGKQDAPETMNPKAIRLVK